VFNINPQIIHIEDHSLNQIMTWRIVKQQHTSTNQITSGNCSVSWNSSTSCHRYENIPKTNHGLLHFHSSISVVQLHRERNMKLHLMASKMH